MLFGVLLIRETWWEEGAGSWELGARTGKEYRLLSEAEWAYACRGPRLRSDAIA